MSVVLSDEIVAGLSLVIVSAIFSLSFGCSSADWTVSVVSAAGCETVGLANEGVGSKGSQPNPGKYTSGQE